MPSTAVRWSCPPYSFAGADALAGALGLSPTVAAILARRGYSTPEAARRFLAADERHPPSAFAGIDAACERILDHVGRGSRIVVHGDYDVDGVCSTAILVRALRALGAEPSWHLPSRFDGGYGLSSATVARLADEGVGLLVTADCGITCAPEVEEAAARGLDVVVTDHHRPGERLPACPTVHPAVGGYPFAELCAAGVAHKLTEALYAAAGLDLGRAEDDLDLVALATVADLVPLRGENRRLVGQGLRALARTEKPGLRALMRVARLDPGALSAHAAGFRLAPRLNAAGRLGRADGALELLLTEDPDRAGQVADELDLLNAERRGTEARILVAAEAARADQADAPAYVLAGEGWHPGVIGIVASRMVERHHRPCVLIALDGDGGRGSGRSIAPYDLHAGLAACAGELRRFGGHRAAAGLEIDADRVEAFRAGFTAHAAAALSADDLTPVEPVDAVVSGAALGLDLAEEIERLEPFGQGNPRPTLLVPGARIADVRGMGEEREHACFTLASGSARARVVAFGTAPGSLAGLGDDPIDVAARLEVNEWNGAVESRLVLRALRPTEAGAFAVLGEERPFWAEVARELRAELDPLGPVSGPGRGRSPRPSAPVRGRSPRPSEGGPVRSVASGPRTVRDRRGDGVAGLAGDLLSTGGSVLLVCAEVGRRQAGLERLLGGLGAALRSCGEAGAADSAAWLGLLSWTELVEDPGLAEPYLHLLAIDPPPGPEERRLLAEAPAREPAFAHLGWGAPEVEFALQVASAELDLRPALVEVYRALRAAGTATAEELEGLLRGAGAHPRSPRTCGRLLRVLLEAGLVRADRPAPEAASYALAPTRRTELERSEAYRAYRARLQLVRRHLASAAPASGPPAPRQAGPAPAEVPRRDGPARRDPGGEEAAVAPLRRRSPEPARPAPDGAPVPAEVERAVA